MSQQQTLPPHVGDELVRGEIDIPWEITPEVRRVMTANSEALEQLLEQLPGQFSVDVPSNKG